MWGVGVVVRAVLDTKRAERRDARRRYERRTALGRGWEWWRVNPLSGSLAPTPTRPATVYNDDVHPDDGDDMDGDSGGEEGLADDQCVVEVLVKGARRITEPAPSRTMHVSVMRRRGRCVCGMQTPS